VIQLNGDGGDQLAAQILSLLMVLGLKMDCKAVDVKVGEKSVAEHKHNDPVSGQTSTMI
jgi:hypothetical protein